MESSIFKSYFYRKVVVLNVFLTYLIVMRHSQPLLRIGIESESGYPLIHGVGTLTQLGVPMFFFISALLFYKGLVMNEVGHKLKRRCRTLLVPYLLWNIIFVAIFWTLTHVPAISSIMNTSPVPSDFGSLAVFVLDSRCTPLWFVKDLMIYCCMAPIFLLLLNNKALYGLCTLGSIAYNVFFDVQYESIFHWLPIYMTGAFVGHFGLYKNVPSQEKRKKLALCCLVSFLFLYALAFYDESLLLPYRIATPLIVWLGYDCVMVKWTLEKFRERQWMHGMFFIYCTHYFMLNVLEKIILRVLPHTRLVLDLTQLVAPVFVFFGLAAASSWMARSKTYKVLTGGR